MILSLSQSLENNYLLCFSKQTNAVGGGVGMPLLIILVFCSVFENASELGVVEVALLVDGRLAEKLVHLLVCESIAHGGQQLPQVVLMDHPWGNKSREVKCSRLRWRYNNARVCVWGGGRFQSRSTHQTPPHRSRRRRCGWRPRGPSRWASLQTWWGTWWSWWAPVLHSSSPRGTHQRGSYLRDMDTVTHQLWNKQSYLPLYGDDRYLILVSAEFHHRILTWV